MYLFACVFIKIEVIACYLVKPLAKGMIGIEIILIKY